MIRSIFILILLIIGSPVSNAQSYFNKRLTMHSIYTVFDNVRQIGDKYYVLGNAADSIYLNTNTYAQSIKFSVFDAQGNIVRDTFYRRDSFNLGYYYNNTIVTDEGNFLLTAQAINNNDAFTSLICLDTLGQLLWEKDYPKPICNDNVYYHTYDIKPTGTGEWLMASHAYCTYTVGTPTVRADILLTKLDSDFNVIWNKTYGDYYFSDWPGEILIESDGYVITGGIDNLYQQSNFLSKAELIKVDTSGSQLWSWTSLPLTLTGKALTVIRTQDGGYVYCGQGDGLEWNGGVYWHSWIEKLDSSRNPVWHKSFSKYSNIESNEQRILKELPNGDIVIAGMVYGGYLPDDTVDQVFGSLIKLTANGDLVWARKYMVDNEPYLSLSIADMQQTPDGGYILVGDATDYGGYYGDPIQRGWIVRVDSNGCEQNGGLCNPTEVGTNKPKNGNELKIYPNPANDVLYIEGGGTMLDYRLTNITGGTVRNGKLNTGRSSIDIKDLSPGMYILHAGNGVYKVVKE